MFQHQVYVLNLPNPSTAQRGKKYSTRRAFVEDTECLFALRRAFAAVNPLELESSTIEGFFHEVKHFCPSRKDNTVHIFSTERHLQVLRGYRMKESNIITF